jgi:hypothetical protein
MSVITQEDVPDHHRSTRRRLLARRTGPGAP